ncbi:hypothetical protein PGT21_018577 [Puccinia graminis f. sp. tritici]|uniref:Uncharacterized protein n=1 Tax=Puccinia graminis f. sp. tritici TaxID=56615 RepID=A0A5B0RLC0_PUCGR|nr:hypothetical protein PGT21_018577 [Puccinia graminis f. sp. tritici]KAA1125514.1 hypothetical protein PGTUg99_012065 [Puccinia graminis f. sp. tritici]KAA1134897.1 hypothetical protein PGTUg99_014463 [Puccinia graminis f. sp. tritici]
MDMLRMLNDGCPSQRPQGIFLLHTWKLANRRSADKRYQHPPGETNAMSSAFYRRRWPMCFYLLLQRGSSMHISFGPKGN